jgi:hypothetical protein
MEQCTLELIQLREAEILISCDWNLIQPSGNDVLTMLLKMCTNFDSCQSFFLPLLSATHYLARKILLCEYQPYKLRGYRQSTVYLACM